MTPGQGEHEVDRVQSSVSQMFEIAYSLRTTGWRAFGDRVASLAHELREAAFQMDERVGRH